MGMEFAIAIRKLLRHKLAIAIGVLVAGAAGILSVYNLNGTSLVAKTGVQHSTASTQVLVDAPSSALADLASQGAGTPLQSLATTLANFAPSQAVLNLIGPAAGLTGGQLYAEGPVSQNLPRTVQEPTDLQRNIQISGEAAPFRLQFNSDPNLPEIGIYAQAGERRRHRADRVPHSAPAGRKGLSEQPGRAPPARTGDRRCRCAEREQDARTDGFPRRVRALVRDDPGRRALACDLADKRDVRARRHTSRRHTSRRHTSLARASQDQAARVKGRQAIGQRRDVGRAAR